MALTSYVCKRVSLLKAKSDWTQCFLFAVPCVTTVVTVTLQCFTQACETLGVLSVYRKSRPFSSANEPIRMRVKSRFPVQEVPVKQEKPLSITRSSVSSLHFCAEFIYLFIYNQIGVVINKYITNYLKDTFIKAKATSAVAHLWCEVEPVWLHIVTHSIWSCSWTLAHTLFLRQRSLIDFSKGFFFFF